MARESRAFFFLFFFCKVGERGEKDGKPGASEMLSQQPIRTLEYRIIVIVWLFFESYCTADEPLLFSRGRAVCVCYSPYTLLPLHESHGKHGGGGFVWGNWGWASLQHRGW